MTNKWAKLSHLLHEGAATGVFSGASAAVGLKGELLWLAAVGRVSSQPQAPPVTPQTIFDLASLTKPLATSLALLLLMTRGQITPSTNLGEVLPDDWLPPDKRPLTIASLLAHRAGLPPWCPFYPKILAAPPEARPTLLERLAAATPLTYTPQTTTLYSDLGFMLLKAVVEHLTGEDLNRFCRRQLYHPLRLTHLGFNPKQQAGGDSLVYAATETGLISGRNTQGEVHDENAWAAGGIAGHAGLFGSVQEVFALVTALYQSFHEQPEAPFPPDLVRFFLHPLVPGGRALGFDTPTANPAARAAGNFFSPHSVGHLGFTGTSFWLDLDSGLLVVLLTNRVHLGRDNDKIKTFRPRFHNAAARLVI